MCIFGDHCYPKCPILPRGCRETWVTCGCGVVEPMVFPPSSFPALRGGCERTGTLNQASRLTHHRLHSLPVGCPHLTLCTSLTSLHPHCYPSQVVSAHLTRSLLPRGSSSVGYCVHLWLTVNLLALREAKALQLLTA